jgi:hypothetical protein
MKIQVKICDNDDAGVPTMTSSTQIMIRHQNKWKFIHQLHTHHQPLLECKNLFLHHKSQYQHSNDMSMMW